MECVLNYIKPTNTGHFQNMHNGNKSYNLRTPQANKDIPKSSSKKGNSARKMSAPPPKGVASGACAANYLPDSPTTRKAAGPPSSGEPSTHGPRSTELSSFMSEMRGFFKEFSAQVNAKLDSVICEINALKSDVALTKNTVRDVEISLTSATERIRDFELHDFPNMKSDLLKLSDEVEEKLTLLELHQRKQNLLIYGLPKKADENIYDTVKAVLVRFFGISPEEAFRIGIINAHRLPSKRGNDRRRGDEEPDAIIVRFVHMADRDRLLHAFEHQPRDRPQSAASDKDPTHPRVTIRSDLPPKMKRERGKLATIAFNLRKNNNLSTRIRVSGTKVILQTRKTVKSGGPPSAWSNWSE